MRITARLSLAAAISLSVAAANSVGVAPPEPYGAVPSPRQLLRVTKSPVAPALSELALFLQPDAVR